MKVKGAKIKVWDLPTRIFHWSLVALFSTALISSERDMYLNIHTTAGYGLLGLILFRLIWGFCGNYFARFGNFLKGRGAGIRYLKGLSNLSPEKHLGHNPVVGWAVMVMLTVTILITFSGVITLGGEEGLGIFAGYFTFETAQYAHTVHMYLAYGLVGLVIIHIGAALFHDLFLKEGLISSMITGKKGVQEDLVDLSALLSRLGRERRVRTVMRSVFSGLRKAALVALVYILCWTVITITVEAKRTPGEGASIEVLAEDGTRRVFEPNGLWRGECGESCHSAYHPTLLPKRSWSTVMANLEDHFGDDASLDEEDREEILAFLLSNSAEASTTEASKKILWNLKKDADGTAPSRITETAYWLKKHEDIDGDIFKREKIWSRANCTACHMDAGNGLFSDSNISVPRS